MNHFKAISKYKDKKCISQSLIIDKISREEISKKVRCYNIEDRFFIMSKSTVVFFEVSKIAYDFLNRNIIANYSKQDLDEMISELQFISSLGTFDELTRDCDEKYYIDNLVFLVTQTCNLNCEYCFADKGTYGASDNYRISNDIVKTSIDKWFVHNKDNEGLIKLQFFGGEPLLNTEAIITALEYSESQKDKYKFEVEYNLITNGVNLDAGFTEVINKYEIKLRVSLDGSRYNNDKYRRFPNGIQSVYDSVIYNLNKFDIDKSKIEIVITYADSEHDLLSSLKDLIAVGFRKFSVNVLIKNERLLHFESQSKLYESLMSVRLSIVDYIYDLSKEGIYIYFDFLPKYIRAIYDSGFECLDEIPSCSAGKRNQVINTMGDIYPCDFFLYNDESKLGNIEHNSLSNDANAVSEALRYRELSGFCSDCDIANICKGRCPFLIDNKSNDSSLYCKNEHNKIDMTLYMLTKLTNKNEHINSVEWENKYERFHLQ